ncbi:MAG: hypothetical protein LBF63_06320 [Treponema sp.]|jgi:hypothetical protein|nr:hypothetical protein [Treponema sp.]
MKRLIAVCMLALVIAPVFAQDPGQESARDPEKKNAVFVDAGYLLMGLIYGGFGIGGGYERALLPQLSVAGNFGYVGFSLENMEYLGFEIRVDVRYYPFGTAPGKFYIGAVTSCASISITYNSSRETSYPVTVAGIAGWKGVSGGGFFWEPYVGYRKGFGELKLPAGAGSSDHLSGLINGLFFGVGLGWVF